MQANEQLFRRIFITIAVCMVIAVAVALGPVWLSAEATRAAQHSQHLKEEISQTLQISESLEMQRAAITNELRLNHSIMEDMGMVRVGGQASYIELSNINPDTGIADVSTAELAVSNQGESDSVAALAAQSLDARTSASSDTAAGQSSTDESESFDIGQIMRDALNTAAQLTAGEASTLLVGDVGLAGMR